MRSLLFVPGNSEKMIAKASAGAADVIILDLEDAVRADAKPEARKVVAETLASPRVGPRRYVRVNSLDTEWCREDVEAVIPDKEAHRPANGPEWAGMGSRQAGRRKRAAKRR